MSELNASNLRKEHGNEGPDLVGTTELTSPYFMVPPSGTTAERPQNPEPGTLRFNTDSGTLEFFRGDTIGWENIVRTTPNLGGGSGSNIGVGVRGIYSCGSHPGDNEINNINYLTISTQGNSTDFGDAIGQRRQGTALASTTRALDIAGYDGSSKRDTIGYVTIATTGDSTSFGTLANVRIGHPAGFASQTRGIVAGGENPSNTNSIEYLTIATLGNGQEFGDINNALQGASGGGSSTRGIIAGGFTPTVLNVIDYITISTLGDAVDFGDLTQARRGASKGQSNNSTRFVMYGGQTPSYVNTIDYITIASKGNAIDFGDATGGTASAVSAACASPTRCVFVGGNSSDPTIVNDISYIEFATLGNGIDFGNAVSAVAGASGCSNGHGGL